MNRRNVLRWLALATVGALLGAGTSALLSDSETSASQTFSDGTLDLVLGGTAQSARINLLDRKPGDSDPAAAQLTLSNNGSLPGALTLKVLQTADPDNTCTEPEDLAEGGDGIDPHNACGADGELDANLNVTLTSGSDTWTGTLDAIHDVIRSLGTLGADGSATDSRTLTIGWDIPGPTTGNDVQSDGATFVVEATLRQAATGEILLLADDAGPGTIALRQAIESAGFQTTTVTPEYSWNGTNPPLDQFSAVVHLNGPTYGTPLPVAAQQALESFVHAGGGFIGGQWNGWERLQGYQTNMNNLVLRTWTGTVAGNNCACPITYTVLPAQSSHPVIAGLPSSFTFSADAHDDGAQVVFATQPSTALMTVNDGSGAGVLVRNFDAGRVVDFSFAPNYAAQNTLQDPNIQRLYVNALTWATG